MPRVSKTKAPVAATPTRTTRSQARAGSVELAEPVDSTPRRSGRVTRSVSRSVTPESKPSSFEKQPVKRLPALAEEEEKHPSPRINLPQPADFAPIADASPYVTPQAYRHIASTYNTLHTSPTVKQSIEQPAVIEESVAIFQDDTIQVEHEEAAQAQIANEEAEEEAVQAQFADDAAHAGLSLSPPTLPSAKSLKRPGSSLVGRESAKRQQPERVNLIQPSPSVHSLDKTVFHSPLATVSANTVSSPTSPFDYAKALSTPSPRLSRPLSSPALSQMERVLHSEALFEGLTERQQIALLMDMRKEIQRLRKIEANYLAASKQSQSSTKSSPQRSIRQASSPEVPRTVGRQWDLRYHMSIANPAKESLEAQRKADDEAIAAAAADNIAQQEQLDQTPSRSSPSTADDKRKSKSPQSKTPEAQTPQRSSQTSASTETPAASPSWGLTSLFGSVKNIFSHRPILSPTKRLQEQPQQQPQEQHQEHPGDVNHQQHTTPARAKKQMRIRPSSQQSPTPKPRSPAPAPPATPTPASDEDPYYGQTPRTKRRPVRRPGSTLSPVKRNTPSKPREVNADRRAEQLEQAALKTADRKRIQEQADKIEQERRRVEEEQRKHDMAEVAAQKTGTKRKVKVDTLAIIPSRAPGASTGTYGLVDGFFDYDSDSDEVEMEEDQIYLLPQVQEHPAKRQRLDANVFQPKAPAIQPPAVSPVKQTAAPALAVPATPTPNYSQLTQQAIEKQRLQFSQHKPKQPSRLRNVERLSTGSTIAASSPQQPLIAPLEDIQEVSPVPQLPNTPPRKVYQWPAGVSMETPETWARIDLLYTPEMRAADHEYFTNGLIAAMANAS